MATTALLQSFDHEDRMSKVYLAHFLSILDWFCPFTEEVNTSFPRAPGDS